jgi:hypothetical protein
VIPEEDYFSADLMLEAVHEKETEMLAKRAPTTKTVDALIATVTASPYYAENTLIRNGDHFFWETIDGIPCGYSPRLSMEGRNATISNDYDVVMAESTFTTSYSLKSGSPGNQDVFLIQPYYGIDTSFTEQYYTEANQIADALGGNATTYRTVNATIDKIADAIEQKTSVWQISRIWIIRNCNMRGSHHQEF